MLTIVLPWSYLVFVFYITDDCKVRLCGLRMPPLFCLAVPTHDTFNGLYLGPHCSPPTWFVEIRLVVCGLILLTECQTDKPAAGSEARPPRRAAFCWLQFRWRSGGGGLVKTCQDILTSLQKHLITDVWLNSTHIRNQWDVSPCCGNLF